MAKRTPPNPKGGRPPSPTPIELKHLRQACREQSTRSLEVLIEVREGYTMQVANSKGDVVTVDACKPADRVKAALAIWEWGHGKPVGWTDEDGLPAGLRDMAPAQRVVYLQGVVAKASALIADAESKLH